QRPPQTGIGAQRRADQLQVGLRQLRPGACEQAGGVAADREGAVAEQGPAQRPGGGPVESQMAQECDVAARAVRPGPKLRPLAVTLERRSADLPDLPTMAEAGMPDFIPLYSWFSIHMPAAAPDDVVSRMEKIILDITNLPETRDF